MREKDLFDAVRKNKPLLIPYYREGERTVVKLESYIRGQQATLNMRLLEEPNDSIQYSMDVRKLKEMEEKSGICYDLSPSITGGN